jgi:hypothetical protein
MRRPASSVHLYAGLVLAGLCLGCTSPEATRTRGGGPGADVGNRGEIVSMHDGSDPYWATPRIPMAAGSTEASTRR